MLCETNKDNSLMHGENMDISLPFLVVLLLSERLRL